MHYILMADVIDSRKKKSKQLLTQFSRAIETANAQFKKHLLSPITITLGDEFQAIAADEQTAIAVVIALEEIIVLKNYDFQLRYVINHGKIDTPINRKLAYGMLGKGLAEARQMLIHLKVDKRTRFRVMVGKPKKNALYADTFLLFQSLIDDWQEKESVLIEAFLKTQNYREAAAYLNRDISLLWRREQTLRIREYKAAKSLLHQIALL